MRDTLISCPRCHVGRLDLHHVTYIYRAGDVVVSDFKMPAWVCDCCHTRQYDAGALRRVHMLGGPGSLTLMLRPGPVRGAWLSGDVYDAPNSRFTLSPHDLRTKR